MTPGLAWPGLVPTLFLWTDRRAIIHFGDVEMSRRRKKETIPSCLFLLQATAVRPRAGGSRQAEGRHSVSTSHALAPARNRQKAIDQSSGLHQAYCEDGSLSNTLPNARIAGPMARGCHWAVESLEPLYGLLRTDVRPCQGHSSLLSCPCRRHSFWLGRIRTGSCTSRKLPTRHGLMIR